MGSFTGSGAQKVFLSLFGIINLHLIGSVPIINAMKNKNKKFEVHSYVEENYTQDALDAYEDMYGENGMDLLWSQESPEEVDELLRAFKD